MNTKTLSTATLYLATIPLANWFISNIGNQAAPGLPHTIPVGFGYQAPSGVLFIGIALFARDILQDQIGKHRVLALIAVGVALSYWINPAVAVASAVAFGCSEIADLFIYSTVRERNRVVAVLVSGATGAVIDSFLFLWIAFGSTLYWQGQVIGKIGMTIICAFALWATNVVSVRLHTVKA
jgi:uncharacterized PurR-regulated membrane protein YhhQ (DUF165 family)